MQQVGGQHLEAIPPGWLTRPPRSDPLDSKTAGHLSGTNEATNEHEVLGSFDLAIRPIQIGWF